MIIWQGFPRQGGKWRCPMGTFHPSSLAGVVWKLEVRQYLCRWSTLVFEFVVLGGPIIAASSGGRGSQYLLPTQVGLFLRGWWLQALQWGVRVIGHGIGGKVSQLKWHCSLKPSRWSKRWWSVVTQSQSCSTSDGSEIQVRWCSVLYGIPYIGYPPPHWLKYLTRY